MRIKNITEQQLDEALNTINKEFDNNVTWKRFDRTGKQFNVTLKVKDSHGKGAKLGISGLMGYGTQRHTVSACWHVHGRFFEELIKQNPDVVIYTAGRKVTRHGGNWEDWNIGSMMNPVYFSEACEC